MPWNSATPKSARSSPRSGNWGSRVNPQKVVVTPPAFDESLLMSRSPGSTAENCAMPSIRLKHPKLEELPPRGRHQGRNRGPRFPEEDEDRRKLASSRLRTPGLRERLFRDDMLIRRRRLRCPRVRSDSPGSPAKWVYSPRVHGSGLWFTRGETQALATATLGTKEDMQRLDLLCLKRKRSKRFMLHYNFPAFSGRRG